MLPCFFLKRVISWHVSPPILYSDIFFSGSNWVNPEDPNVIAENELLGAAAAIEAAARKLAELKPKPRPKVKPRRLLGGLEIICDAL